jgi:hypothetical protein
MDIKIRKESNGSLNAEEDYDFSKGGDAEVSVECGEHMSDEFILKKDSLAYLNKMASSQGMKVVKIDGIQKTISPAKVERGESVRVKYLKYPVEILPKNKSE